jgi:hypothetical protein
MLVIIFIISNLKRISVLRTSLFTAIALLFIINLFSEYIPSTFTENSSARTGAEVLHKLDIGEDDLVLTNLRHITLAYDYHYNRKTHWAALAFEPAHVFNTDKASLKRKIYKTEDKILIFENEILPENHRKFLYTFYDEKQYLEIYSEYIPYLIVRDSIIYYDKYVKIFEIDKSNLFKQNEIDVKNENPFIQ